MGIDLPLRLREDPDPDGLPLSPALQILGAMRIIIIPDKAIELIFPRGVDNVGESLCGERLRVYVFLTGQENGLW